MIILRKNFTRVCREKHVRSYDTEDPRNHSELHKRSSHDSGPGWEESSSSSSYSEVRNFGVTTALLKTGVEAAKVSKAGPEAQKTMMSKNPLISASRSYSSREPVSDEDMKKAETEGVVQRKPNGKWGIISKRKREWWSADYSSKAKAEAGLRGYQMNKRG